MIFKKLYDRVLTWAAHPRATGYMAGLSFAESTFFPIPPDVMLIPMMLARPAQIWRLATICAVMSVTGGLFGYFIGLWAFEYIDPWIRSLGYGGAFASAIEAFDRWGFWFILAAGFSPIPYKVFTIAAGVIGMPLLPFIAGSIVGRGGRFFLEAVVIKLGGESAAERLRGWIEWLGWLLVAAIAAVVIWWKWMNP
jgi:membrane protein YqaA with SNARE-associated domain